MDRKLTALQIGNEALARSDYQAARDAFENAHTAQPSVDALLGLSQAYGGLGEAKASLDAIDRALKIDPQHLPALLAKGDFYHGRQDTKTAGSFYQAALALATQGGVAPQSITAAVRENLQRAQLRCQEYVAQYESYLRGALAEEISRSVSGPAGGFSQSIDLIFGKRSRYQQQPTKYYFPELPAQQFYDPQKFQWVEELNAATAAIRDELNRVIDLNDAFVPYVQRNIDTPASDSHGMMNNPNWSAWYLWKDGKAVAENIDQCPATAAALRKIPLADIPGASPSALFSVLRAGARIPPHTGVTNTRLICHLPLIVPDQCGFRVGNESRAWVEGETWIFDDTIEHEAWNNSGEDRYVLIFDIPQPHMTPEDHSAVGKLFEAIDAYGSNLR